MRNFWEKSSSVGKILISIGVFLLMTVVLLTGVIIVFTLQDNSISVRDVEVTNLTDTAFTLTWVSDEKYEGRVVYKEGEGWPAVLAQLGQEIAFDDRDVELKEDGTYRISDAGIKPRHTHHVTVRNLNPDTEYGFRIAGQINGKEAEVTKVKTKAIIEDLNTPDPGYGKVENANNEDAMIILTHKDKPEISLSSYLSPEGTYSIDFNGFGVENVYAMDLVVKFVSQEDVIAQASFESGGYKPLNTIDYSGQKQENNKDEINEGESLIGKMNAQDERCVVENGELNNIDLCCTVDGELNFGEEPNENDGYQPDHRWCLCWEAKGVNSVKYDLKLPIDSDILDKHRRICTKEPDKALSIGLAGQDLQETGDFGSKFSLENTSILRINPYSPENASCRSYDDYMDIYHDDSVFRKFSDSDECEMYGPGDSCLILADHNQEIWLFAERDAGSTANCDTGRKNLIRSKKELEEVDLSLNNKRYSVIVSDDLNPYKMSCQNWNVKSIADKSIFDNRVDTFNRCGGFDAPFGRCEGSYSRYDIFVESAYEKDNYYCENRIKYFYKLRYELRMKFSINLVDGSCQMLNGVFDFDRPDSDNRLWEELTEDHFLIKGDLELINDFVNRYPNNDNADVLTNPKKGKAFISWSGGEPLIIAAEGKDAEEPAVCQRVLNEVTNESFIAVRNIDSYMYFTLDEGSESILESDSQRLYGCNVGTNDEYLNEVKEDEDGYIVKENDGKKIHIFYNSKSIDTAKEKCKSVVLNISEDGSNSLNKSLFSGVSAQTPQSREAVLGAGTENTDGIEATESGRYVFFENGERIAQSDVIVQGDKITIKLFNDVNANGVKDEGEEFFEDYSQIELAKEASLEEFNLTSGWNLINIPMYDTRTEEAVVKASDLLDYWNDQGVDIKHVARFVGGQFQMYSKRESGTEYSPDFDLLPGQALFVLNLGTSQTVSFSGKRFEGGVGLTMENGWNLVGIMPEEEKTYDTEGLFTAMEDQDIRASVISQYESGKYESVIKEEETLFGNNYNILEKRGYFIKVEEGGDLSFTP